MNDLIKEKMEIAAKVGALHKEITDLEFQKGCLLSKQKHGEGIKVITGNHTSFYSAEIDSSSDNNFHDLIIGWLQEQIDKRAAKLDDLIKILK